MKQFNVDWYNLGGRIIIRKKKLNKILNSMRAHKPAEVARCLWNNIEEQTHDHGK